MSRLMRASVIVAAVGFMAGAAVPRVSAEYRVATPPPVTGEDAAIAAETPDLYDDSVVHELSITVASDNWLTLLGCRRGSRPGVPVGPRVDVPAILEIDGQQFADVGVRCKGNSSLGINGDKKPLNITTDAFVAGQDLWGFDVINLNNNWSDPSQLREAIILRAVREYAPAPRSAFARVTVQGEYIGLYTMVEQINGEFADYWYPDDGGLIIKGDSPVRIAFNTSGLTWEGESLEAYRRNYEVKGPNAAGDEGYEALRELIRALDAPESNGGLGSAALRDGIRQVLDVESALWYLAANNILANFDSYYVGKNYYLYLGRRDPRFHMVTWDTGLGFGIFGLQGSSGRPGAGATTPARVSPFAQESDAGRPLIRRLLAVPEFRADYIAHYRALHEEVFTTAWMDGVGTRYQDLIRDAVRAEAAAQGNVSGAFTFAQFEANLRQAVSGRAPGGMGGAPGIIPFVADRRAYLGGLSELRSPDVSLRDVRHDPEAPTGADAVVVSAEFAGAASVASVELRYRVDGGMEHVVPLLSGDGAVWRGTIPAHRPGRVVGYVLRVAVGNGVGDVVFFPSATLTKPLAYSVGGVRLPQGEPGDIVVNELMADNATTLADEAGEFDDWIELFNRGVEPLSLAGLFLSDDEEDPWAYALPDQVLGPGERLLVWCDNDPDQGPLHADFRLNKDGETVFLSSADARLETVTFGALAADESYMRLPDGGPDWVVCARGTPGETNACDPASIATPAPPTTPPTPGDPTTTPTPTRTPTRTPGVGPSATPTSGDEPSPTGTPAARIWLPIADR